MTRRDHQKRARERAKTSKESKKATRKPTPPRFLAKMPKVPTSEPMDPNTNGMKKMRVFEERTAILL